MRIINPIHKHIVTAFVATIMFPAAVMAEDIAIDDLFVELLAVPAEQSEQLERITTKITDKISAIWADSGSASMDLLLKRGRDAQDSGDLLAATEHFSALVDHAPDFAEGYYARARAYFEAGYFGPALADLRITLALNPRHFKAMIGLAALQDAMGEAEQALQTYRKVLEINPNDADVQKAVARLEAVAL